MIIYKKAWPLVISLLIAIPTIKSQNSPKLYNDALSDFMIEHPAENVYVHTDRAIYSVNDSIWFKIYLTDAHSMLTHPGLRNVYVELMNETDTIKIRNLIRVNDGFGKGDISLAHYNLKEGQYRLRAYTDYQRNFGSEFFFEKTLLLKELSNQSFKLEKRKKEKRKAKNSDLQKTIDLQFLPESGYLVLNRPNTLAFVAKTTSGHPIDVSGWILDSQDNRVVRFTSLHQGMGKTMLFPKRNEAYRAVIDGYPGKYIQLPQATNNIQLSVSNRNDKTINVRLWCEQNQGKKYYLVNSSKGVITFFLPLEMTSIEKNLQLKSHHFSMGINQLTIANNEMQPIAERLIFIKKEPPLKIKLQTAKKSYSTREKVDVTLSTKHGAQCLPAHLSITAINGNQVVPLEKYPQNILSYLLLDSELKGTIPNPAYYFKDDSVSTREKLDLLMLTHGWRKYNWNAFDEKIPSINYQAQNGIQVRGRVKRLFGKKGINNGEVTIFMNNPNNNDYQTHQTKTDSLGNFIFKALNIDDSTNVFVQGLNGKHKRNTELIDLSSFTPPPAINTQTLSLHIPGEQQQARFIKMANERMVIDRAFFPEKNSRLLKEVKIKALNKEHTEASDGHYRLYGKADKVLVVKDTDWVYMNVWDYLSGRVAGVAVTSDNMGNNTITIRGTSSFSPTSSPDVNAKQSSKSPSISSDYVPQPLFILDGFIVPNDVFNTLSMADIDKIEVLNGSSAAIFGVRGGGGVLAVYTKRGIDTLQKDYVKGILTSQLRGYHKARQFYSPLYEAAPNIIPDHRATLYWNPEIITDSDGTAKFSFFTSDDRAPLLLMVEGISFDGKPGTGFIKLDMGQN